MTMTDVWGATRQAFGPVLNGQIRHSVCRWCYDKILFETFAGEVKKLGITAIELCGPSEWPVLMKMVLTCLFQSLIYILVYINSHE